MEEVTEPVFERAATLEIHLKPDEAKRVKDLAQSLELVGSHELGDGVCQPAWHSGVAWAGTIRAHVLGPAIEPVDAPQLRVMASQKASPAWAP